MAWSGGTFTRVGGSTAWADDRDAGTGITSALHDTHDEDLATGLENAIIRDGQNSPSADLPMNSKKFINAGEATARDEYVILSQQQTNAVRLGFLTSVTTGGGKTVYNMTMTPTLTAYVEGMVVFFRSTQDNLHTDTRMNINGLGEVTVGKTTSSALVAGDIQSDYMIAAVYRTSGSVRFQLLNPQTK